MIDGRWQWDELWALIGEVAALTSARQYTPSMMRAMYGICSRGKDCLTEKRGRLLQRSPPSEMENVMQIVPKVTRGGQPDAYLEGYIRLASQVKS